MSVKKAHKSASKKSRQAAGKMVKRSAASSKASRTSKRSKSTVSRLMEKAGHFGTIRTSQSGSRDRSQRWAVVPSLRALMDKESRLTRRKKSQKCQSRLATEGEKRN